MIATTAQLRATAPAVREDLVITMRKIAEGGEAFDAGVSGHTSYLAVPLPLVESGPADVAVTVPTPAHALATGGRADQEEWFDLLLAQAAQGESPGGDVLVFIHGYSNDLSIIMKRHRQLRRDLAARGYRGAVVSFDWPCGDNFAGYLSDRFKAHEVAPRFAADLLVPFAARARLGNCQVNVHVVAHSTGAYLFQEAADLADEHKGAAGVDWAVGQLVLIGGDVDRDALAAGDADGESMLRHCARLTNYSNPYDSVLKISGAKRAGLAPRVGRVGLPAGAPPHAVDVDCGDYFAHQRPRGAKPCYGYECHSWHVGDPAWTDDLFLTLQGDIDRNVFPTRARADDGSLALRRAPAG